MSHMSHCHVRPRKYSKLLEAIKTVSHSTIPEGFMLMVGTSRLPDNSTAQLEPH